MPFIPAPPPQAPGRPVPVMTRAIARIIWSALAVAVVVAVAAVLAVAAATAPPRGAEALGPVLLAVAAVMTAVELPLAYLVTARMRRKPPPGAPPAGVAGTQTIVACAIAVGATLTCCVFYFVSREPLILLLVVPCAAVLLHWFPSEARWARLAPAPAPPADATRRPMVRE